jgi:chlorobactene glucosyltransferase
MEASLIWLVLSTLLALASLAFIAWLHNRHHPGLPIPPAPPPSEAPLISVIVPARDEARNLPRCLTGLLAQTYPRLEFIVVDDGSTDATPEILAGFAARETRLRVILGQPLPKGWAGKPHALTQGAETAQGEWLCFVDADTFAAPHLLASAYAAALSHNADLFTLLTRQELGTFWEKVLMPVVFTGIAAGFPTQHVNDPRRPEAIANGQFILIRRAVYEALGGHRALRSSIVEDRDLAARVKRAGYRLVLGDGRALARTRMYTSFREIWEGWTKNIYFGVRDRRWLLALGVLVSTAGALFLPGWLTAGWAWWRAGGDWPALAVLAEAALVWGCVLYTRAQVAREFAISRWYALTLPLGAILFGAMLGTSTLKVLSGKGVTWKGRTYITS